MEEVAAGVEGDDHCVWVGGWGEGDGLWLGLLVLLWGFGSSGGGVVVGGAIGVVGGSGGGRVDLVLCFGWVDDLVEDVGEVAVFDPVFDVLDCAFAFGRELDFGLLFLLWLRAFAILAFRVWLFCWWRGRCDVCFGLFKTSSEQLFVTPGKLFLWSQSGRDIIFERSVLVVASAFDRHDVPVIWLRSQGTAKVILTRTEIDEVRDGVASGIGNGRSEIVDVGSENAYLVHFLDVHAHGHIADKLVRGLHGSVTGTLRSEWESYQEVLPDCADIVHE